MQPVRCQSQSGAKHICVLPPCTKARKKKKEEKDKGVGGGGGGGGEKKKVVVQAKVMDATLVFKRD